MIILMQDMTNSYKSKAHCCILLILRLFLGISKVSCECNYGDVRLVYEQSPFRGRVETCYNQRCNSESNCWWTVDYNINWNNNSSGVVCRQLGHSVEGSLPLRYNHTGRPDDMGRALTINCIGNESKLIDCSTDINTMDHLMDAGVQCRPSPPQNISVEVIGVNTLSISWETPSDVPDYPGARLTEGILSLVIIILVMLLIVAGIGLAYPRCIRSRVRDKKYLSNVAKFLDQCIFVSGSDAHIKHYPVIPSTQITTSDTNNRVAAPTHQYFDQSLHNPIYCSAISNNHIMADPSVSTTAKPYDVPLSTLKRAS